MLKILIIGLDGGTFDLIKPWVDEGKLPNIAGLMKSGLYSDLKTTIPPMTFPAWNAFMTGKNPGKHGVFDFMERKTGTYELELMNAGHRRCETIWKIASRAGKRCAVVGVPVTYPPEEINGVMISGFDAPFLDERIMYPRQLFDELKENVGQYIVSAGFSKHLKSGNIDNALDEMLKVVDRKADTAKYILREKESDIFMIVFGETDAAIHYFWKYHDAGSPQRAIRDGGELGFDPIYEVYKRVDHHIGEFLQMISDDTTVMIMSDHGAGGAGNRVIFPNRFLENHGLLNFNNMPVMTFFNRGMENLKAYVRIMLPEKVMKYIRFNPKGLGLKFESKLRYSYIDWRTTRVYADETPYYPNFRVNLKGREPEGTVDASEYDDVVAQAISLLDDWHDDATGNKVVRKAYRKEELYNGGYLEKAPDIIVDWNYHDGYSYLFRPSFFSKKGRPTGSVTVKDIERSDSMVNRSGSHRDNGVFIISGKAIDSAKENLGDISILDLAPTILYLLDLPVPVDMDGKICLQCFKKGLLKEPVFEEPGTADKIEDDYKYDEEEADETKKRLKDLGYL